MLKNVFVKHWDKDLHIVIPFLLWLFSNYTATVTNKLWKNIITCTMFFDISSIKWRLASCKTVYANVQNEWRRICINNNSFCLFLSFFLSPSVSLSPRGKLLTNGAWDKNSIQRNFLILKINLHMLTCFPEPAFYHLLV